MQNIVQTVFTEDYKIIDENLYIVVPERTKNFIHRRLLPDENIYVGYYLNLIKKKFDVKFTIKECIQGKKVDNVYTKLILDILKFVNQGKISKEFAKLMFVKFIGCTELSTDINIMDEFQHVYSVDDIDSCDGHIQKINQDYYMNFYTKQV